MLRQGLVTALVILTFFLTTQGLAKKKYEGCHREKSLSFKPNPEFIKPGQCQLAKYEFEDIEEFANSPFVSLLESTPIDEGLEVDYVAIKVVSTVNRNAQMFSEDENYNDENIKQLFINAKLKRTHDQEVPQEFWNQGVETDLEGRYFEADLETGYNNLFFESLGIEEKITFYTTFAKTGYKANRPPGPLYFDGTTNSKIPAVLLEQPGLAYSFLMSSSLSTYYLTPCSEAICGQGLTEKDYTMIISYHVFAIKRDLPLVVSWFGNIPDEMVVNIESFIPNLLERFYQL